MSYPRFIFPPSGSPDEDVYLILPAVRRLHVAAAHALHILLDRDGGAELVPPPRPVRRLQTHHLHRDVLLERGHAGVGDAPVTGSGAPVDQQMPWDDLKQKQRFIRTWRSATCKFCEGMVQSRFEWSNSKRNNLTCSMELLPDTASSG